MGSREEVLQVMEIGARNRAVAETKMNERSSRSHSVLTVIVDGISHVTGQRTHGCLHLIDLAGAWSPLHPPLNPGSSPSVRGPPAVKASIVTVPQEWHQGGSPIHLAVGATCRGCNTHPLLAHHLKAPTSADTGAQC